MLGAVQVFEENVRRSKVDHWIVHRLEPQESPLAIGNPVSTETHSHSATQRFNIKQSFRQRFGHENRPITPVDNGPCCHDSSILFHLGSFRYAAVVEVVLTMPWADGTDENREIRPSASVG